MKRNIYFYHVNVRIYVYILIIKFDNLFQLQLLEDVQSSEEEENYKLFLVDTYNNGYFKKNIIQLRKF